jgi:glutamine amidotransferase|tara:strand:+ start:28 stop:645 length:618 start_codon:yes stop_codon:yes gene_type:complete
MKNIGIICAGPANYLSICNAVKKTGHKPILIKNNKTKEKFSHLILPGVGSFGAVIREINKKKLLKLILNHIKFKRPLLGICVGYQILFENSEEDLKSQGLRYFKGKLKNLDDILNIVPSIGWQKTILEKKLIKKLKLPYKKANLYYAHSYYVNKYNKKEIMGFINLNKKKIPVLAIKGNVLGVQFHPEKSGYDGIEFLSSFFNLK